MVMLRLVVFEVSTVGIARKRGFAFGRISSCARPVQRFPVFAAVVAITSVVEWLSFAEILW